MSSSLLPYRRGVGILLFNDHKQVFTGQRIDNPGPAWQLPQGGIDEGEDPLSAAFRELEEETGIHQDKVELLTQSNGWLRYELPDDLIPTLWGGRYRGQEQRWLCFSLFRRRCGYLYPYSASGIFGLAMVGFRRHPPFDCSLQEKPL